MSFWCQNGVCSNNRYSHKRTKIKFSHGAAALLAACAVQAVAQEAVPPGIVATFDVTQRLEYSDNPDLEEDGESDLFGRTILNFGLRSETSIETFRLNLGTDIEEGGRDQSTIDATNAFVNLNYDRDTRNALLGFDLNYREADSSSTFVENEPVSGSSINQDEGTRRTFGFAIRGAVGREAPIGASFDWSYDRLTYSDTSDPDLDGQTTSDFSGQVDFRLDSRSTASLTTKYIDFDAEGDGVDRKTTGFGSAIDVDLSAILSVDANLSYDRIERSGGETGVDEGLSGGLGITRQLTNGSIGLSYQSDVASNEDGRRSFLRLNRSMDLPRGSLSFTLGLTGADGVGTDPLFEASYLHNLATSSFNLSFEQSVENDDDNNEEIITRLRANYDKEINSISSLGLSVTLFGRNELQDNDNDGERLDISLTYRHDLTRDWGLVGGVSHVLSKEDDEGDRRSNTVFIGLQRSFDWRP